MASCSCCRQLAPAKQGRGSTVWALRCRAAVTEAPLHPSSLPRRSPAACQDGQPQGSSVVTHHERSSARLCKPVQPGPLRLSPSCFAGSGTMRQQPSQHLIPDLGRSGHCPGRRPGRHSPRPQHQDWPSSPVMTPHLESLPCLCLHCYISPCNLIRLVSQTPGAEPRPLNQCLWKAS